MPLGCSLQIGQVSCPAVLPGGFPVLHSEADEVGVAGVETETRVDLRPRHGSRVVPGNQIQLTETLTYIIIICSVCFHTSIPNVHIYKGQGERLSVIELGHYQ